MVARASSSTTPAGTRLARDLAELDEIAAGHGLTLALHPHVGTLVETADDVERALAATDVGWCFDSGHLLIGGVDPAAFVRDHAERIVHVHLKDVDAALAARVRAGELSLVAATQAGLFRPLGQGDAGIDEVVASSTQTGTSAGSCSSRTPPSPGRSPRLVTDRFSMSGGASST